MNSYRSTMIRSLTKAAVVALAWRLVILVVAFRQYRESNLSSRRNWRMSSRKSISK